MRASFFASVVKSGSLPKRDPQKTQRDLGLKVIRNSFHLLVTLCCYSYSMSEILNSPIILSIVFPTLTVLGCLPLLRWAVSGEKANVFASLSVGLACLIALVCAYGRPGEPFQFGMAAMIYGIGAVSLLCLISSAYIQQMTLRWLFVLLSILIWVWIVVGMPLDLKNLYGASLAGGALLGLGIIFTLRTRFEFYCHNDVISPLIALLVCSLSLYGFALINDVQPAQNFAMALSVICLSALIWTIPKFGFSFTENALLPLSLCVAALVWDMWLHGLLPLVSILCLVMIMFARPATVRLLTNAPTWLNKTFYVLLSFMCLLPAFLSAVFFDVLRNL